MLTLIRLVVLAGLVGAALPADADAQIVSADQRITALVTEARETSHTFRGQLDALQASKVVVEVIWSAKLPEHVPAALFGAESAPPSVHPITGARHFLVGLNLRRLPKDASARMVASLLAHELQHVAERALGASASRFVARGVPETVEAQQVQRTVFAEMARERTDKAQ